METLSKYRVPMYEANRLIKVKDPAVAAVETLKSLQEAVRSELINCEPGSEFNTLVQTLQHNIDGLQQVKDDILEAFQNYYSGVFKDDQLHLFGSAVMGIALKDSDLDFYVELPYFEQTKPAKRIHIEMVKTILERSGKFTRFVVKTKPRIPLVRCVHIATLTRCDLNCTNGLGALNSPIIAHLLNFDPRIHQLAIIIKYWMKIHGCAGIRRISYYAIVWMLIFYLQTLPQPIVPPIAEFQLNVPPSMHSHFNFGFDYSLKNTTKNQSQLPELLLGFFKFYRDFDYVSLVICPLYGKTLSKRDVADREGVELQRYREILWTNRKELPMMLDKYSLCIQDPFEIIRKIPGEILDDAYKKFVGKFGYAAAIIECELRKGEIKSLFSQLFDVDKFEQFVNRKLDPRMIEAERNGYLSITSVMSRKNRIITLQLSPTNFILKMSQWTILAKNNTVPMDEHSIRKRWAEEVIAMVVVVLEEIFNLDLYHQDDDDDDHHDDGDDDKFVKSFDLIGARNIFGRRKQKRICATTWKDEVIDSLTRFEQARITPLELSATIIADIKCFDHVKIEFSDKIKTNRNNFWDTFCEEFIDRIDYFLQVYFVHRNEEADTVKKRLSNMPLAPRPKTSETLSCTPILHPIAGSSRSTFKLFPLEFALCMAGNILSHSEERSYEDAKRKKRSVQQIWAEEVIKMIGELLSDIFKLELHNQTSSTYQLTSDLTGLCGKPNRMFSRRKLTKSLTAITWTKEIRDSSARFQSSSLCRNVPSKLSATITADASQFDYVVIEFCDQIRTQRNNFYRNFCWEFVGSINYFQHIYFAHRHEVVRSASVSEHSATTKPAATESATQQISISTLPRTLIISHPATTKPAAAESATQHISISTFTSTSIISHSATTKPAAAESATQQKSISPLPSTSIVSHPAITKPAVSVSATHQKSISLLLNTSIISHPATTKPAATESATQQKSISTLPPNVSQNEQNPANTPPDSCCFL